MKVLIALAALVAVSAASYVYHGEYPGKCGADGLYFRNAKSFVFCSNGNSYVQPCAPGTRNSAKGKYSYGGAYGYSDFCDVNLNDGDYVEKYDVGKGYEAPAKAPKAYDDDHYGYAPYGAYGGYGYGYAPYGAYGGYGGYGRY